MMNQSKKNPIGLNLSALKKEPVLWTAAFISVLYLVVCIFVIFCTAKLITEKYVSMLGENAADFAYTVSRSLKADNEDIRQLKLLEFDRLPEHQLNKSLTFLFGEKITFQDEYRYVYVYAPLAENEIKYFVTEDDSPLYRLPPGTPLDAMYLLDVYSEPNDYGRSLFKQDYYRDKNRYLKISSEQQAAAQSKSKGSVLINDSRGKFMFGYAPFYTAESEYAGTVGIEIFLTKVTAYKNSIIVLFTLVFLIPTGLAIIVSFLFYIKYVKPLQTTSITDSLTGLYNREYFKIRYEKTVENNYRYKSELAIIMLDIDCFKLYNDTYGHQKGDECLVQVASIIKSRANRPLDLVFRYGGEEFLVLLPDTGLEGATNVATKILSGINELEIEHSENTAASHVTISQGIFVLSSSTTRCENIHEYVERADKALYRSKHDGKNRYTVFIPLPEVSAPAATPKSDSASSHAPV